MKNQIIQSPQMKRIFMSSELIVSYTLTLLGKVVYNSQIAIGKALNYYWKLQALESIQTSSPALPKEELSKLIDTLIDNHEIKDILMESISLSSTENNSKVVISTAVIEQSRRM